MKIQKKASATWTGSIKEGKGQISTESKALSQQPYGFQTRFEDQPGTNPEELVGAAHAGCFTMALSKVIGEAGHTAEKLETQAVVTLEKNNDGFSITKIQLSLTGQVPGMDEQDFTKAAQTAKENCPISKLLNAEISLETNFQSA
jgi:osmotically inducible protein OsmC